MSRPALPAWRTILVPSLFLLVSMLNLTLIVAGAKEVFVGELGGSVRDVSLFFSIEMVAYIVFAPLWGLVSDRMGQRKPLVVVGFAASAALYASYSTIDHLPTLLALRFLQGAVTVMGWSTLMTMVTDAAVPERRGRTMGLMGGALSLGVSLGAPLGGYLSRDLGPYAPLRVAAVLFALLAVGSLLLLKDPPQLARHTTLREVAGALGRSPRLLIPYAFYFVDRFTVGFFVVLFPLYLGSLGIEDPAVRGRYLALFLLPFALLQYPTGRLLERIGPYRPLIAGSLTYGILLCVVGYADLYALWWVMTGLGVLAAVMFPPTITLTASYAEPGTRGSAIGGFNLAGSLGFAIGPLVGTWAFEQQGYGFAFVIAGALEILAAVGALLWIARRLMRGAR